MRKFMIIFSFLILTSCAGSHEIKGDGKDFDPWEPYNRGVSGFNNALDTAVFKPVAEGYRWITPDFFRVAVRNVLDNLKQPLYLANNLLQGDFKGASYNLKRFTANTLIGVAGVFDIASHEDMPNDKEDFGQTLAVWGVGSGPYFVLPILGPSNIRDSVGLGVHWYADPINRYAQNTDRSEIKISRAVIEGLSIREENIETIDSLKETSVDFYATMRSIYRQRRADAISDGSYEPDFPEFDEDFEEL